MQSRSDSELVALAQGGDREAFATLYDRWFDAVHDFAARMMRNSDDAADVAQDTFLKAMNGLSKLQSGSSFKCWIFCIARNTALNRLEKSGRTRPLTYQDGDGEQVTLDVIDADRLANPADAAEAASVASLVWEAAAGLDERQYALLDLHIRQGLDSAEIADALGVTRNNGYVMLNRMKRAVEDAIGAYVMFTLGRRHCPRLDDLLGGGRMSPLTRSMVAKHVAECDECDSRREYLVASVVEGHAEVRRPAAPESSILRFPDFREAALAA